MWRYSESGVADYRTARTKDIESSLINNRFLIRVLNKNVQKLLLLERGLSWLDSHAYINFVGL